MAEDFISFGKVFGENFVKMPFEENLHYNNVRALQLDAIKGAYVNFNPGEYIVPEAQFEKIQKGNFISQYELQNRDLEISRQNHLPTSTFLEYEEPKKIILVNKDLQGEGNVIRLTKNPEPKFTAKPQTSESTQIPILGKQSFKNSGMNTLKYVRQVLGGKETTAIGKNTRLLGNLGYEVEGNYNTRSVNQMHAITTDFSKFLKDYNTLNLDTQHYGVSGKTMQALVDVKNNLAYWWESLPPDTGMFGKAEIKNLLRSILNPIMPWAFDYPTWRQSVISNAFTGQHLIEGPVVFKRLLAEIPSEAWLNKLYKNSSKLGEIIKKRSLLEQLIKQETPSWNAEAKLKLNEFSDKIKGTPEYSEFIKKNFPINKNEKLCVDLFKEITSEYTQFFAEDTLKMTIEDLSNLDPVNPVYQAAILQENFKQIVEVKAQYTLESNLRANEHQILLDKSNKVAQMLEERNALDIQRFQESEKMLEKRTQETVAKIKESSKATVEKITESSNATVAKITEEMVNRENLLNQRIKELEQNISTQTDKLEDNFSIQEKAQTNQFNILSDYMGQTSKETIQKLLKEAVKEADLRVAKEREYVSNAWKKTKEVDYQKNLIVFQEKQVQIDALSQELQVSKQRINADIQFLDKLKAENNTVLQENNILKQNKNVLSEEIARQKVVLTKAQEFNTNLDLKVKTLNKEATKMMLKYANEQTTNMDKTMQIINKDTQIRELNFKIKELNDNLVAQTSFNKKAQEVIQFVQEPEYKHKFITEETSKVNDSYKDSYSQAQTKRNLDYMMRPEEGYEVKKYNTKDKVLTATTKTKIGGQTLIHDQLWEPADFLEK